jgi:hypothetical protein
MRFTHFLRRILSTGEVEKLPFDEPHFQEAGVPASKMSGMPILEAYQLVNKWNVQQGTQRFMFALEQ